MSGSYKSHAKTAYVLLAVMTVFALMFACSADRVYAAPSVNGRGADGACRSQVFERLTPEDIPSDGAIGVMADNSGRAKKARRAAGSSGTDTYIPLVMIAIGFEGQPYSDEYDWHDAVFENDESVEKFYKDMSLGKFTFAPAQETSAYGVDGNTNTPDAVDDGIIHISLDREKLRGWELNNAGRADALEMLTVFHDVLIEAGNYIDFAAYDSNGDGEIQTSELAVGFIAAGKDAAAHIGYSFKPAAEYVWPHAFSFSEYSNYYDDLPEAPVVGGVIVDDYIAIAETAEKGSRLVRSGLGTLAHELGHYLGLPDLYPTTDDRGAWASYRVDYLSLMDYGNYGVDEEGNNRPFSLDMWSRVYLGWVDPEEAEPGTELSILGSQSSDAEEGVLAARVETPNEGEYYIIENRRFSGWDECMYKTKYYPDAFLAGEDGDHGGGLVFWHIDDNINTDYMYSNTINVTTHRPGVMPLFYEKNESGYSLIGTTVFTSSAFFDADSWERDMLLPLYGTDGSDRPVNRKQTADLAFSIDSVNLPVMDCHLHSFTELSTSWSEDHTSGALTGHCGHCGNDVVIDKTQDITSEVIAKPSSTETGIRRYTANYSIDSYTDTTDVVIPVLDEETLAEREEEREALRSSIEQMSSVLDPQAGEEYKASYIQALRDVIDEVSIALEDDTYTPEDVRAAQETLSAAWNDLLENGSKIRQSMTVKPVKRTVNYSKVKKKKRTVSRPVTVRNYKGKLTYTKTGGSKKFTVNKKTGKLTVKKGTKRGTYKVRIRVNAAGNANYLAAKKTVTVRIRVK